MAQDSAKMKTKNSASSLKPEMATSECRFCCEKKPSSEFTKIQPCNHQVCTVCMARYCQSNVNLNNNVDGVLWACPWGDGWFEPIIYMDAWKKENPVRITFWDKILLKLLPKELKKDREMKLMARKNHWRRCPKCRYYVQKVGGCPIIHCR
jgi:hypothetical protein